MSTLFARFVSLDRFTINSVWNCARNFSAASSLRKERPSTEELIQWKKLPAPKTPEKDFWSAKRALFGENDYRDILGDGTYSLRKNVKHGPWWMRGWRGNELQMLIRKRRNVGYKMGPETKHNMSKRIKYLYKFLNRNKGRTYYGGD